MVVDMIQQIQKEAYAKINLGLDVLRRRPDGYHEVKMIMQTVNLSDRLTICRSPQPGITFAMETEGQAVTSLVPVDDTNLVCKAARKPSHTGGCPFYPAEKHTGGSRNGGGKY